MTVRRNIGFGLRAARLPKAEIERRVREVAAILGLEELLDRRPAELSGGQRQRVSMGRAIVREPQVFLFDEPLSNLDAELRVRMRSEIKKLHQKVATTVVYVTHDQVEAMSLADRIVVMRDGHIQQVGTPMELFERPANLFVAGFIGTPSMNLLDGRITSRDGAMAVELEGGLVLPLPAAPPLARGRAVVLGIRPDDLELAGDAAAGDGRHVIEAPIRVVEPMGAEAILLLELAGQEVIGKARGRALPALGPARLTIATPHLHLFDKGTGLALA
jgi:multiple sugar transport system ATP-binding protein